MKICPEPELPLRPKGTFEKFMLYSFERRDRWLDVQAVVVMLMLALWVITQLWVFGLLVAFSVIHVYLGLEARAVCRMIRRASRHEDERLPDASA